MSLEPSARIATLLRPWTCALLNELNDETVITNQLKWGLNNQLPRPIEQINLKNWNLWQRMEQPNPIKKYFLKGKSPLLSTLHARTRISPPFPTQKSLICQDSAKLGGSNLQNT